MANRDVDSLWERALDNSQSLDQEPFPPLYSIPIEDEKSVLEWVGNTLHNLREIRVDKVEQWNNNINYYKGVVDSPGEKIILDRKRVYQSNTRKGRVVVNEAYEIVEQKVAHIMRYKPNVIPIPANNEYNDRDAARMAEYVIDYLKEELKLEKVWEKTHRHKYILGESYVYINYDPYKGPVHPDWEKIKKERGEVRIQNHAGETISLDVAVRVGEVAVQVLMPHQVYIEPVEDFEEARWCVIEKIVDIEDIRAIYGNDIDVKSIKKKTLDYPSSHGNTTIPSNKVRQYEIFHIGCSLMDKGRYIKVIDGHVLVNREHIYAHRRLPITRLTDIDIPGDMGTMSTLENIQGLNKVYNIAITNMARAVAIVAHPRIFFKKGSANKADFTNGINIIEYKTEKPTVDVPNVISRDVFAFKDELRKDIERHSGVHGISRGSPPPGIRAGIALQFLEEQENQRANAEIIKNNIAILEFWGQVLSLVGQFYTADDGRTFKVVGKDGEFTVKSLGQADLSQPFDIRIQNTSSLPSSIAGRTQTILDYRETLGEEVVPNDQVADMLGLAQPEKFISYVSAAVRMAESENEDMFKGGKAKVELFHEHVSHWRTHFKAMQTRGYAEDTDDNVKAVFRLHLLTHERVMYEKAITSPGYQARLNELENFPVFYRPETKPAPQTAPNMLGGEQGGAMPPLPPELQQLANQEAVPQGEVMPPDAGVPQAPMPAQSPI